MAIRRREGFKAVNFTLCICATLCLVLVVEPSAAIMLADKGAGVIIGRRWPGPKMMDVIKEREMRMVRRVGTVEDVAKELRE